MGKLRIVDKGIRVGIYGYNIQAYVHCLLQDGMGKLRIVDKGIRVEGETEFLSSIHATKISSRQVSLC